MAELKKISDAMKLIDAKKESLRKAFEDLDAHSSSLSSFTLTWPAIDARFSSIQSSLTRQFETLQSRTASVPENDTPPANNAVSLPPQNDAVPSHPQLRLICSAMDAEPLLRYIMDHPNDREALRSELLEAFQVAPDPAKMVLDALTRFFPSKAYGDGSSELHTLRRSCVFILERLMLFSPEIGEDVRQRAKSLAEEWKGKMKIGDNTLKPLGFLHLLGAYGLGSDYDSTELIELLIDVVRFREVYGLCRGLNLVDKVPDLIEKLISSGKQNLAVKFVLEFKLTHKFPLIPLLKDILESARNAAKKLCKDGKLSLQSKNEAASKEISSLKQVIKYINEYNLENEYPVGPLEKRLQNIESHMAARAAAKKRLVGAGYAPAPIMSRQQKQQRRNHQAQGRRTTAPAPAPAPAPAGPSSVLSSADGPPPPPVPSAGLCGIIPGLPMGFPGNIAPPYLHPMEPQLPLAFPHAGFGLQSHYPPPYFPHY